MKLEISDVTKLRRSVLVPSFHTTTIKTEFINFIHHLIFKAKQYAERNIVEELDCSSVQHLPERV